jgi:hypothetical protein
LTKTITVFVIISDPGQAVDVVQISQIKTTMAFATTALMLGRNPEIQAGTGRATSTGMARVAAEDVVIIADDKSFVITQIDNYIFE